MSESIINKNLKTFQIVTVIFPVESIGRSMVRLLRKNAPYHVRKRQHDGLEISVSSASTVRSHAVDIWAAFQRREVVRVLVVCVKGSGLTEALNIRRCHSCFYHVGSF